MHQHEGPHAYRVLRLPEVSKATGKARSTIYADVARGTFPRPIKIGERAVGWREIDIAKWLAEREVA